MAPIERKPLPPPNSRITPLAETDGANIIARANDVLDYYLNGPGSYFDGGTRKPLVSEFGDSTVSDLKRFKDSVIASKQFADDPNSIMDSIVDLVSKAIERVEQIAQDNEVRDSISRSPPDTNDPIDDPRVISPRALGSSALPISLSVEGETPASAPGVKETPEISSAKPIRYLGRMDGNTSPASGFGTNLPAARFVLPDQTNSFGRSTNWATALVRLGSLNPALGTAPPQADGTPQIASTTPVRYLSRTIADKPHASAFDAGAPALPFVLSNASSPD